MDSRPTDQIFSSSTRPFFAFAWLVPIDPVKGPSNAPSSGLLFLLPQHGLVYEHVCCVLGSVIQTVRQLHAEVFGQCSCHISELNIYQVDEWGDKKHPKQEIEFIPLVTQTKNAEWWFPGCMCKAHFPSLIPLRICFITLGSGTNNFYK